MAGVGLTVGCQRPSNASSALAGPWSAEHIIVRPAVHTHRRSANVAASVGPK